MLMVCLVPHYSVEAREAKDIQKAVRFASKHDLYLVVKNTGHDQYVALLHSFSAQSNAYQSRTVKRKGFILHLDAQHERPNLA